MQRLRPWRDLVVGFPASESMTRLCGVVACPLRDGVLSPSDYLDKTASPVSHPQREEFKEAAYRVGRDALKHDDPVCRYAGSEIAVRSDQPLRVRHAFASVGGRVAIEHLGKNAEAQRAMRNTIAAGERGVAEGRDHEEFFFPEPTA